jgi:hypothetical protein
MKVYIAGPMTGYFRFNYPAFNAAQADLEERGHEVLSPAVHDLTVPKPWDFYMRHAIGLLIQADAIALLPGWDNSRGATLEHIIGGALGMDIRPIEEWVS